MASINIFLVKLYCLLVYLHLRLTNGERVTCQGTSFGSNQPHNRLTVRELAERYIQCTNIEGNLELIDIPALPNQSPDSSDNQYSSSYDYDYSSELGETNANDDDIELSFLQSIEEITGYLLIYHVHRKDIPLNQLRIIRGQETYQGDALVVTTNVPTESIKILQLSSLKEITQGGVRISRNHRLCYVDTINWGELQEGVQAVIEENGRSCSDEVCDDSCTSGCWAGGPNDCVEQTLTICDESCPYRCRGPGPGDCCHDQCAGGCTGIGNTDCYSCRHFTNGDQCVSACPPRMIYNAVTYMAEPNPDFKYEHRAQCVESCPDPLLGQGEYCVKDCTVGYQNVDGECIECDDICPKNCTGLSFNEGLLLRHFEGDDLWNCTRIVGNLLINDESFRDDPFQGIVGISAEHLDAFRSVSEITGYLALSWTTPRHYLTELTVFENLKTIKGGDEYLIGRSLYTFVLDIPLLQLADFSSLRSVKGDIYAVDTCYHTLEMFQELLLDSGDDVFLSAPQTQCGGSVCHEECTRIGCWGGEAGQCFNCRNAVLEDGTCVPPCNSEDHYVLPSTDGGDTETCGVCHEECLGGCTGPSDRDCRSCRNFQFGLSCISECHENQYPVGGDTCESCPDFCLNGCSGAEHKIGEGGCNECIVVLLDHEGNFMSCLDSTNSCNGNHVITNSNEYPNSEVCQECHPECEGGCLRPMDASSCKRCRRHTQGIYCVKKCAHSEYSGPDKICKACHSSCLHCTNGTENDCTKCENLEVPLADNKKKCVSECPIELPFVLSDTNTCVESCPEDSFASKGNFCKSCDQECVGGCTNETSKGCEECEHVSLDGSCLAQCPDSYEDSGGICKLSDGLMGTPVKISVLILILILLVILVIAIAIIAWRIKYGSFRRFPNQVHLQDMSRIRDNDYSAGGNGAA